MSPLVWFVKRVLDSPTESFSALIWFVTKVQYYGIWSCSFLMIFEVHAAIKQRRIYVKDVPGVLTLVTSEVLTQVTA